jgi:4'-phosphopantetheinyl transferase
VVERTLAFPTETRVELPADQVHIFTAALDRPPDEAARLFRLLSDDERKRFQRVRLERQRARFLVGRAVLREILSAYIGILPQALTFAYGVRGKPYLLEASGGGTIHFSLSHSHNVAVYAVARNREVGIDLERLHPMAHLVRLTEMLLAPAEIEAFRLADPGVSESLLLKFWTRKEAFVKGVGVGLGAPLARVDVSSEGRVRALDQGDSAAVAARWRIMDLDAPPGYIAALAGEGDRWRDVYRSAVPCQPEQVGGTAFPVQSRRTRAWS